MRMRGSWLGDVVVGKGRAVKTYICTYKHLWGRSDGRPTSTGRRSGSGLHMDLSKFHGKVPFPQAEIASRDPDRRPDTHESNWPTVTTQDRQWRPVTAHSQVSSSLIGNSALRECLDHSTTRIYLHSGSVSLSLFFLVHTIVFHDPQYRSSTGCPWPNFTAGPYAAKHHTYHRRSSIGDHDHPLQASSVDAQLWEYAHIRSNEHYPGC